MRTLIETITVKPFSLGTLFGASPLTLRVQGPTLQITLQGDIINIPFAEISDSIAMKKGIIFNKVIFTGAQKTLVAIWLKPSNAQRVMDLAIDTYHQAIADSITILHDSIEQQFTLHYPRKRIVIKWREECQLWRKRIRRLPSTEVVSSADLQSFKFVMRYADMDEHDFRRSQHAYLKRQLKKFNAYFDEIESHPLTYQQRIACIADEENNLVIAGAGSGKTSVMMGRAGYLVASDQAKAKDILLLAFGRKAAREMSERISEKMPGVDVRASTFHSLGQDIISKVENGKPSLSVLAEDRYAFRHFVDDCFKELMNDPVYREIVVNYFVESLNEEVDPFMYQQEGEYLQALINNDIRTLKGELVKSFQESVIANFLLRQGIEYRYEFKYKHDTKTLEYRQYKPDFYLPELGINRCISIRSLIRLSKSLHL